VRSIKAKQALGITQATHACYRASLLTSNPRCWPSSTAPSSDWWGWESGSNIAVRHFGPICHHFYVNITPQRAVVLHTEKV